MDRNLPDTLCTIFLETQKPKRLSFGHQSVLKKQYAAHGSEGAAVRRKPSVCGLLAGIMPDSEIARGFISIPDANRPHCILYILQVSYTVRTPFGSKGGIKK